MSDDTTAAGPGALIFDTARTVEQISNLVTERDRLRADRDHLQQRVISRSHQVEELQADNERLGNEVERLRAALTFYADPASYSEWRPEHPGRRFSRPIEYDTTQECRGALWAAGERARKALQEPIAPEPREEVEPEGFDRPPKQEKE